MMRRIHSAWRIVTDDPPAPAARVHRARIRIRQGDLLVLARHHLSIQCVEALYLLAPLRGLLSEPRGFGPRPRRSLTISGIELREIAGDALIDLFQTPLHFRLGKVPLPRIHRLELAAVNGHARVAEEIEPPAQQNECAADFADRLTVILAEIRNGLEVRHQTAGQPDQLDIALTLPLKPPARLDTIEVAIDVNFQQGRRMVRWPTRCEGLNTLEAEPGKIQFLHKDVDRPDWIVLAYIVVKSLGKQRTLTAVVAYRKTCHRSPAKSLENHNINRARFHTGCSDSGLIGEPWAW